LRLEQLTLFELEPALQEPGPGPAAMFGARLPQVNAELPQVKAEPAVAAEPAFLRSARPLQTNAEGPAPDRRQLGPRRPIRRAWLPRLIRWVRARAVRPD